MRVPNYLYIPKKLKPKNIDLSVFGSHFDIMPTLYNLSLSDTEYMAMGNNLFSEKSVNNIAYNDLGILADKNYIIKYDFANKRCSYYVWGENYLLKNYDNSGVHSNIPNGYKRLIKRYLSMISVADYLIKETGK
jgi:phosphoglycerol transferase MdoB-like AlkP superfamily enzyme